MDTLVENMNYYNQIKENLIKSEIYEATSYKMTDGYNNCRNTNISTDTYIINNFYYNFF